MAELFAAVLVAVVFRLATFFAPVFLGVAFLSVLRVAAFAFEVVFLFDVVFALDVAFAFDGAFEALFFAAPAFFDRTFFLVVVLFFAMTASRTSCL